MLTDPERRRVLRWGRGPERKARAEGGWGPERNRRGGAVFCRVGPERGSSEGGGF